MHSHDTNNLRYCITIDLSNLKNSKGHSWDTKTQKSPDFPGKY